MYVSAIIDPSALDKKLYYNDRSLDNIVYFIREIYDSGVLLFDDQDLLRNSLNNCCKTLPSKVTKQITVLMAEIKKQNKFITLPVEISTMGFIYDLAARYLPDTVLVGDKKYEGIKTTVLTEYVLSSFATERRAVAPNNLPISDSCDEKLVYDAVSRCVKFSPFIKIKDKQIGKIDKKTVEASASKKKIEPLYWFYEGIKYIVEIWVDSVVVTGKKRLEIYTVYDARGGYTMPETMSVLGKYLIEKLAADFPDIEITVNLHNDRSGDYHARFLESKYAALNFERGFDLLYSKDRPGMFKRNILHKMNNSDCSGYPVSTRIDFRTYNLSD